MLPSINLPIMPTLCNIANIIECVMMFYLRPLDFGRWYLSLLLSFHGKSEDEPPASVPTCVAGIPPAAV